MKARKRVRNLAFVLVLVAAAFASQTASAEGEGCYYCSWNEWCNEVDFNEIGRTVCTDSNSNPPMDECSTGGQNCTPPVAD